MTVTPSGIEELTAADQAEPNESIATQIERLADLLPSQGPITAFAFLNPLQGLHNTPFIDALRQVKDIFGSEPFLLESEYRSRLADRLIDASDLQEILCEEPDSVDNHLIAQLISPTQLRMSMLLHSINPGHRTRAALGDRRDRRLHSIPPRDFAHRS